jgi:hypothetical protein
MNIKILTAVMKSVHLQLDNFVAKGMERLPKRTENMFVIYLMTLFQ